MDRLQLKEIIKEEIKIIKEGLDDFEKFLIVMDSVPENKLRKELFKGEIYIDTPGMYQDEKDDYDDIHDFMISNMGSSDYDELVDFYKKNKKLCQSFTKKYGRNKALYEVIREEVQSLITEKVRSGFKQAWKQKEYKKDMTPKVKAKLDAQKAKFDKRVADISKRTKISQKDVESMARRVKKGTLANLIAFQHIFGKSKKLKIDFSDLDFTGSREAAIEDGHATLKQAKAYDVLASGLSYLDDIVWKMRDLEKDLTDLRRL